MSGVAPEITLRVVEQADIDVFYDHQRDADATAMAAFPTRDYATHVAHWQEKILNNDTGVARTVLLNDHIAGYITSWVQDGHREVGYWIGKPFWGKGIATAALRAFLSIIQERPLYAWVARHNVASMRVL